MNRKYRGTTLRISTLALTLGIGAYAQAPVLITKAINENKLVTLAGNTRPEATAENDRGRVDDSMVLDHILLLLKRAPEQEQAAAKLIDQMHEPGTPNYHKWMTADQWGKKFGLAKQDRDTVSQWLQSHGITVNSTYKNGMVMDITATAGQVREAFHTEIHNILVNGESHIANMGDPLVPEALSAAMYGPISLHDFRPQPLVRTRSTNPAYDGTCGSQTCYNVTPEDLSVIYGLTPLFKNKKSGAGQTVVVLEEGNLYSPADWAVFRTTFGLNQFTHGSLKSSHPQPSSGKHNCKDPGVVNGVSLEVAVDAEYASAAAPDATIDVASCADTKVTIGLMLAFQNLLNAAPPSIVSISYGGCEVGWGQSGNAMFQTTYQQAVAEGTSVFVAAGDEGAAGCNQNQKDAINGIAVSAFASTQYNVAVGGTDYQDFLLGNQSTYWKTTNGPYYESAISYIPEIPWNDSCASGLLVAWLNTQGNSFPAAYGKDGLCNDSKYSFALTTASGSGGPSGCATGTPKIGGVVSGSCAGWPKPSWQAGVVGIPADGVRDLPDVSLFASNGWYGHYFPLCDSNPGDGGSPCSGAPDTWVCGNNPGCGAGGTSFSSPIIAGIQALVNQVHGKQGNPNYVYYKLAAVEYGTSGSNTCDSSLGNKISRQCIFHDVTAGDMDVPCVQNHSCYRPGGTYGVLSTSEKEYQPAYGTNVGWDFATGIGTVNAAQMVANWKTVAP